MEIFKLTLSQMLMMFVFIIAGFVIGGYEFKSLITDKKVYLATFYVSFINLIVANNKEQASLLRCLLFVVFVSYKISDAAFIIANLALSYVIPPCIKPTYGGFIGASALSSMLAPETKVPAAIIT